MTMFRFKAKLGDIFEANLDEKTKKYFQYVGNDLTQLNSEVIKVFKKTYPAGNQPDFADLIKGETDFYAHCVIKWGVKQGLWSRVFNATVEDVDIIFRDSGGELSEKVSHDWWVWKINGDMRRVGPLVGENRKAEIGVVVPPASIIYRMRTGKYDFVYPQYE